MPDTLIYNSDVTPRKGVLGVLKGVCADTIRSTRNGRKYSEKLWENVFKDEIVQEYFKSGGLLGELNHPTDREETDLQKVAICMPEPPTKNSKGQLEGSWDILDTPNGRILKCLCDYGYKIGISSRGSGDLVEDWDGSQSVDPETYHLEAFDAVLLPAVKAARLTAVNESFVPTKSLRRALAESYNKATDEEKKVMSETLEALDIDYKDSSEVEEEDVAPDSKEAVNDGDLVEELQQALKENATMKAELAALQEKLSVSYAKELDAREDIAKLKAAVVRISESAKKSEHLTKRVSQLTEQLANSTSRCSLLENQLKSAQRRLQVETNTRARLDESLNTSKRQLATNDSKLAQLKESYEKQKAENSAKISALMDDIKELRADAAVNQKLYSEKLQNARSLVERYKRDCTLILEHYIEGKATMIGVSVDEIKNKLPKNATVKNVDAICEDLKAYKLSMNRLPFAFGGTVKSITKTDDASVVRKMNPDDDVDASLFDIFNTNS